MSRYDLYKTKEQSLRSRPTCRQAVKESNPVSITHRSGQRSNPSRPILGVHFLEDPPENLMRMIFDKRKFG